jgi:hypothetical protein
MTTELPLSDMLRVHMSKPRTERRRNAVKAYLKSSFLTSAGARPLRILAEYLEPKNCFDRYRIEDR